MELSTAIHLIDKGIPKSDKPQYWADLGAGDGLFTQALGSLLPAGSSITAVDQNATVLKSIPWKLDGVSLRTHVGNFVSMDWGENFDGILMANALHFVQNQSEFLSKIKSKLSKLGAVLIVEYDRKRSNQWVPYPITFAKLRDIGEEVGFSSTEKLNEVPSIYDGTSIYSSILLQ